LRLIPQPWEADAAHHEALRAYQMDLIKTGKGLTPICKERATELRARSLIRIKLSGAQFRYVVWRWATGMALGGGASSPVAKEGPLSSGGLFHFPV
jgi:hypothetical protein